MVPPAQDAQRLEGSLKDSRVRLLEPDESRIHDHFKVGSNPRRGESLFDSTVAVGHDAEAETGLSHPGEGRRGAGMHRAPQVTLACSRSSVSRTNPSFSRGTPARRKRLSR